MKVLLIGMDGCHEEVFKRGWTPFVSARAKSMQQLDIDTDLISRGWLEIALGVHGKDTKAVYDRPKLDGSYAWTKKFSLPDVPSLGRSVKPIWQKLNEQGITVGILNVPTTYPAPEVNGFFVSGGGGGAPVVQSPTIELCRPKEILPDLLDYGYIVDERMYELVVNNKLSSAEKILNRMAKKNERRTDSFIKLNKKFNVDFGFVVYRTASVVAESLLMGEFSRRRNSANQPDDLTVQAAEKYYRNFDAQIQRLAEAFPNAELVFVSDHGTAEVTHKINPNILLQEQGLQSKSAAKNYLKEAISVAKRALPFRLKSYLRKTSLTKIDSIGSVGFDPSRTLAFCKTVENWNSGIYINDQARFGGPVSDEEFDSIKKAILAAFSNSTEVIAHGIRAHAVSDTPGERHAHFPDISVHAPNGYLFDDNLDVLVEKFMPKRSPSSLSSIMEGEILYMKSHSPVALFSQAFCDHFESEDLVGDLTIVYDRILDFFELGTKNAPKT